MYTEWRSQYTDKAGFYESTNLELTRQELYEVHRIIPKLTLDHKARRTKLKVQCSDGPAVFLCAGSHAEETRAFLERHDMAYRGQSLSAACNEVFMKLIRPKREHLSGQARRKLIASQKGRCAICTSPLECVELDHIAPLSQQTASTKQVFQALCPTCHATKSDSSQTKPENPILSYFSPATYQFVKTPRPAQCVFCPQAIAPRQKVAHVDIRRCRKSCLREAQDPFPVFCARDEILPTDGALGDFCFIDLPTPKTRAAILRMLPFDGPRWYSRGATQHLMRFGLVKWENIPYTFSSTAHLPADFFVEPLTIIEDTCSLAKPAINGLLGVWSIDTHHSWIVSTQKDEYSTLAFDDKLLVRPGAPGGMIDVCYRQQQIVRSSMRPIVHIVCLLYTSPSPRDRTRSRMPSSA